MQFAPLSTTADSVLTVDENRRAVVALHPDHPGFRDDAYRARRNHIAQVAVDYISGGIIPEVEYTSEEHGVWRLITRDIKPVHERYACQEYLDYWGKMALPEENIPQLEEVSRRVRKLSGFRLEPVAGLIQARDFLGHLRKQIFLSTQYIRHASRPAYTPEPDIVHELVGHAGQLASPRFSDLNRLFGEAAFVAASNEALAKLDRVYWFTMEFGVVKEKGECKAYGAGLLSSMGELSQFNGVDLRPFDIEAIEKQSFDVTHYQPVLFVADSVDYLYDTLSAYLQKRARS